MRGRFNMNREVRRGLLDVPMNSPVPAKAAPALKAARARLGGAERVSAPVMRQSFNPVGGLLSMPSPSAPNNNIGIESLTSIAQRGMANSQFGLPQPADLAAKAVVPGYSAASVLAAGSKPVPWSSTQGGFNGFQGSQPVGQVDTTSRAAAGLGRAYRGDSGGPIAGNSFNSGFGSINTGFGSIGNGGFGSMGSGTFGMGGGFGYGGAGNYGGDSFGGFSLGGPFGGGGAMFKKMAK